MGALRFGQEQHTLSQQVEWFVMLCRFRDDRTYLGDLFFWGVSQERRGYVQLAGRSSARAARFGGELGCEASL
jgi:hypothetical protein